MTFDPSFFLIAIPAMIFSGFSKAGFGSGASFAGAALMALIVDPVVALGISLPLFMLVDVVALPTFWRKWDWDGVKVVILGSIPGVILGIWLYQVADADVFRILLGGISLLFVAWQMSNWGRSGAINPGPTFGVISGVVAGFTSFVSHAGGPAVSVYLLAKNMGKTQFQASTVLIFWVINILKFIPYTILGIFTVQTLIADLILAPFVVLGAWLGIKAHFYVPERPFFAVTYVLLTLTGAKLLWDGVF